MFKKSLNKLFELSPTIERSERKPLRALITVVALAMSWCILFCLLFLMEFSWMAAICLGNAIIGMVLISLLKRNGKAALFTAVFTAQLISFLLFSSYFIEWDYGFHYPIFIIFLFIFLPKYKHKFYPIAVSLVAYGSLLFAYYYIQHLNPEKLYFTDDLFTVMHFANITITCTGLAVMSKLFQLDSLLSEEIVTIEKQKSEDLLHNILPISIADRLKDNQEIIADGFDMVSVMFVDIVGFTKLSEQIPPNEVVSRLNEMFTEFDHLVEKYGLEKIKTIGDAYMVSGGLPEQDKGHLEKMGRIALEMLQVADSASNLQIRIGIHAGPVVAGVIGVKKFAYDLWGDTVNTASRMESHGLPGKINVTENVMELLKDKFEFEKRELIEVKGKGMMQTYFLKG